MARTKNGQAGGKDLKDYWFHDNNILRIPGQVATRFRLIPPPDSVYVATRFRASRHP